MRAVHVALACLLLAGCASAPLAPMSNRALAEDARISGVRNFESLDALPEPVRASAIEHLRDRAGDFFPRMAFGLAQYRTVPNGDGPRYVIEFRFADAQAGIEAFNVQLHVAADGRLLAPPKLPDFRRTPAKMQFAALADVEAVARREGFLRRGSRPSLTYDAHSDSIAWAFPQYTHGNQFEILTVSAHTGEILDRGIGFSMD